MLATYPVKIVNNQIQWIGTPPDFSVITEGVFIVSTDILPTVSEQTKRPKRQIPPILKGRGQEFGDIFDMADSYADWNPMP